MNKNQFLLFFLLQVLLILGEAGRGKYSEMKVMGRCKGDFQLEIDNFKVLIVVTKYNNCFFVQQKGVVGQ